MYCVFVVFCETAVSLGSPGQSSFPLSALVILQHDNACSIVSLTHLIFNASVIFI